MSSIFASRTRKTIELDDRQADGSPHTVTIQQLSWRHLEAAEVEKAVIGQQFIGRLGGAEYRKQIAELEKAMKDSDADALPEPQQAKVSDPLNGFDKGVLLSRGIVAWTYDEPLTLVLVDEIDMSGRPMKVSRVPAIEDLRPDVVDRLAREILQLTKPSLFLTPEQDEAAQKETPGPVLVP